MNTIKLKKGLDILISGAADEQNIGEIISKEIGIVPDYYEGIVPKVAVKEGDEVQIGSPVFYDKAHPELKIVSPVCGKVKEVARGERRKLLYILIERNESFFRTSGRVEKNVDDAKIIDKFIEDELILNNSNYFKIKNDINDILTSDIFKDALKRVKNV